MGVFELRDGARRALRAKREKVPLLTLRHQSEDLPRPHRSFGAFEARPLESKGDSNKDAPKAELSPFSLESLIMEELAPPAPPPSKVPFLWELRRQAGRTTEEDAHLWGGLTAPMAKALYRRAQGYLVWTEGQVMGGRDDDLRAARRWLEAIPPHHYEEEERGAFGPMGPEDVLLIRGALTLEAYQVYEAHILGADAFLIFPQLLSIGQLEEVIGYGEEVGVMPLAVVWGEAALMGAEVAGAKAVVVTPQDPLSETTVKSRACLDTFGALKEALEGFPYRLAYAPLAKAPRLLDFAEAGATGLVSCARGGALLEDLRGPS